MRAMTRRDSLDLRGRVPFKAIFFDWSESLQEALKEKSESKLNSNSMG